MIFQGDYLHYLYYTITTSYYELLYISISILEWCNRLLLLLLSANCDSSELSACFSMTGYLLYGLKNISKDISGNKVVLRFH